MLGWLAYVRKVLRLIPKDSVFVVVLAMYNIVHTPLLIDVMRLLLYPRLSAAFVRVRIRVLQDLCPTLRFLTMDVLLPRFGFDGRSNGDCVTEYSSVLYFVISCFTSDVWTILILLVCRLNVMVALCPICECSGARCECSASLNGCEARAWLTELCDVDVSCVSPCVSSFEEAWSCPYILSCETGVDTV